MLWLCSVAVVTLALFTKSCAIKIQHVFTILSLRFDINHMHVRCGLMNPQKNGLFAVLYAFRKFAWTVIGNFE